MSAELVPAENMVALEQLDPQAHEVDVTHMLSEARSWLAHALEATEPTSVAKFRAFVSTIAEITRQLNLSKELQLDAVEMVRRAERGVGVAIRQGQDEGSILRSRQQRQGSTPPNGVEGKPPASPTDFVSKGALYGPTANQAGILDLVDGVSEEKFEEALTEGKAEGNLSRANVARKLKNEAPKPSGRPEILRKTRHINSNRVVRETVLSVADPCPPSLFEHVDYSQLDRSNLEGWVSSLSESIRALRSLKTSLEKELTHVRD